MWKKSSAKSKIPPDTGLPSTVTCFSSRCQPRGRGMSTAVLSFRRYSFWLVSGPPSKVIVRRTASRMLICPSIMLCQVGQLASSKSAMKVAAPQLSALITILRSVGPVISTRRSSMSFGCARHHPVAVANRLVCGRKSGSLPWSNSLPGGARREQLLAAGLELAMKLGDEAERFRAEDLGEGRRNGAGNGDTLRKRADMCIAAFYYANVAVQHEIPFRSE